MTELELYKFIQEWEPQYRWENNDVLLWVSAIYWDEFAKLLSPTLFDDSSIEAHITTDGTIALYMGEICEHFGIKLENIFEK